MAPEDLHNLEVKLSERIIKQYNQFKSKLKSERYAFYIDRAKKGAELIENYDKKAADVLKSKNRTKENQVMVKRIKNILHGMDKGLINIKQKPVTIHDRLYKEAKLWSKQVKKAPSLTLKP